MAETKIIDAVLKLAAVDVTGGQFVPVGIVGSDTSVAIEIIVLKDAILGLGGATLPTTLLLYQLRSEKGVADGYVPLNASVKVPSEYIDIDGGGF